MSSGSTPGEIFQQRRAAAAASKKQDITQSAAATTPPGTVAGVRPGPAPAANGPSGFLAIQQEQQRVKDRSNPQKSQPKRMSGTPKTNQRGPVSSFGQQRSSGDIGGAGGGARRPSSRRSQSASSQRQSAAHHAEYPTELGIICSLRDSFGFIHCADRMAEVFFHYSSVDQNHVHPDELHIDMEVEFRIGPSSKDPSQIAAYNVRPLPEGQSIEWESQDNPGKVYQGYVHKIARNDRSNRNEPIEGVIVVTPPSGKDSAEGAGTDMPPNDSANDDNRQTVQYVPNAYTPSKKKKGPARLGKGDTVEFIIVTDRRTKNKYAKEIRLLQSERERKQQQEIAAQLANADTERGVVTSIKNGYGFIRSTSRTQQVYFHFSNVVSTEIGSSPEVNGTKEDDKNDNDNDNDNGTSSDATDLRAIQPGQECEFQVVCTKQQDSTSESKTSAHNVRLLPEGTVLFRKVVARNQTGIVSLCPRPPSTVFGTNRNRRNPGDGQSKNNDGMPGKLRLKQSISIKNGGASTDDSGSDTNVAEIDFEWDQVPGGIYTPPVFGPGNASGGGNSSSGLWIKPGDTFRFDIVHDLAKDTYKAIPCQPDQSAINKIERAPTLPSKQFLQLTNLSPVGRYEGVVHVLKDEKGFGFLKFTDRHVDVHFKFADILPNDIHSLIFPNTSREDLRIGASVSFDLASRPGRGMVGNIGHGRGKSPPRRGRGNTQKFEKELIHAQRVMVLPADHAVELEVVFRKDVNGTVSKEEPRQLYSGTVELEQEFHDRLSTVQRYPGVVKMLQSIADEFRSPNGRESVVFPEALPTAEDETIVAIIDELFSETLEVQHIPVPAFDAHAGRLCITPQSPSPKSGREDGSPAESSVPEVPPDESSDDPNADASTAVKEGTDDTPNSNKGKPRKKKYQTKGPTRTFHFDKSLIAEEFKDDIPPGVGDTVQCDLVMIRRMGRLVVRNIRIVDRAERSDNTPDTQTTSGIGVVKEVNEKRNFGFVHVLDETASKREVLFFSLNDVQRPSSSDASDPSSRGGIIKKGDEVKFVIATEKNRKMVAKQIEVMAKGTIPNKPASNACFGIVLLEPSHTKLSDTPARKLRHAASAGSADSGKVASRWQNTPDVTHKHHHKEIVEDGCILLLEDKTGMFNKRAPPVSSKSSGSIDSVSGLEGTDEAGDSTSSKPDGEQQPKHQGTPPEVSMVMKHLSYKNGSIAIHGAGSATCVDGSTHPKRGDYVSFVKANHGRGVRDIRVVRRQDAERVRGHLESIVCLNQPDDEQNSGTAKFVAATPDKKAYDIDLEEVVSCDASLLKEKESVEGILCQGRIFGVCRTTDLYLESKLGTARKERPRLNLTVRKDRGGTIMAQSMMAKGPDGTNGFVSGWTSRKSKFLPEQTEDVDASETAVADDESGN